MNSSLVLFSALVLMPVSGTQEIDRGQADQNGLRAGDSANSSSLANFVAELSADVRDGNVDKLADRFHPRTSFAIPLPSEPVRRLFPQPSRSSGLSPSNRLLYCSRSEVADRWRALLERFGALTSVRFTVLNSEIAGRNPVWAEGVRLSFSLSGTGTGGIPIRIAAVGSLDLDFEPARGWRISRFQVERLDQTIGMPEVATSHSGFTARALPKGPETD